jgi:hypothetical protein
LVTPSLTKLGYGEYPVNWLKMCNYSREPRTTGYSLPLSSSSSLSMTSPSAFTSTSGVMNVTWLEITASTGIEDGDDNINGCDINWLPFRSLHTIIMSAHTLAVDAFIDMMYAPQLSQLHSLTILEVTHQCCGDELLTAILAAWPSLTTLEISMTHIDNNREGLKQTARIKPLLTKLCNGANGNGDDHQLVVWSHVSLTHLNIAAKLQECYDNWMFPNLKQLTISTWTGDDNSWVMHCNVHILFLNHPFLSTCTFAVSPIDISSINRCHGLSVKPSGRLLHVHRY